MEKIYTVDKWQYIGNGKIVDFFFDIFYIPMSLSVAMH